MKPTYEGLDAIATALNLKNKAKNAAGDLLCGKYNWTTEHSVGGIALNMVFNGLDINKQARSVNEFLFETDSA